MNFLKLDAESGMLLVMLGNLFVSVIGLTFTIGAPVEPEKKGQKFWWILTWVGLTVYYFIQLSGFRLSLIINLILIDSSTIFTIFLTISYLGIRVKKYQYVIFGICFSTLWTIEAVNGVYNLFSLIIASLSFLWLGYIHRIKDLTKALLVVTYGISQLPSYILDSSAISTTSYTGYLAALIPLKLTLISAIYSYLGIKDSTSKVNHEVLEIVRSLDSKLDTLKDSSIKEMREKS